MAIYTIGIQHSSIASARTVTMDGSLSKAKLMATREFGEEQLDYRIVILDDKEQIVASRKVGDARWA